MSTPQQFAAQYGQLATAVGARIGVAPETLLGQWGLETGWGAKAIPGTNNLGNIKDFSGGGTAATDNMTGSRDNYRQYDTPEAFGSDFASLIERRYPNAVGAGSDPEAFAAALKAGGYAEDPGYVGKVKAAAQMALNVLVPAANAGELSALDKLDQEFFGKAGSQAQTTPAAGGSPLDELDAKFFGQQAQPEAPPVVTQVSADGKGDKVSWEEPSVNPLKETAKVLGKSVYGGLTSIPRAVMAGGDFLEKTFPTPSWSKIPFPPGAEALNNLDQRILKQVQPESELGKAASNIGESAVGAIAGPAGGLSMAARGIIGAGSGAGGELAARLLGDNALTRIGGGILGGGVTAAARSATNAKSLMQRAVQGVPEEDWRAAELMKATLEKEGIPHLNSQLLGPSSTMADLGARVASHPTVRPGLNAKLSETQNAMVQSFENWRNTNLPPSVTSSQSVLSDVQGTAASRLRGLRKEATKGYEDLIPTGASADPVSPEALEDGIKIFKQMRLDPDYGGPSGEPGKAMARQINKLQSMLARAKDPSHADGPPTLGELNGALKDLNQQTKKFGYSGTTNERIKQAYRDMTPEFEDARNEMSRIMREEVEPANKSLLGQIAQMGGGVKPDKVTATDRMLDLVFPSGKAQPQEIKELGKHLGPDAIGEITREYLSRAMNRAAAESLSGGLQKPFDFRVAVYGTPAQKVNLEAALEVASKSAGANPAAVKEGFKKILDAFKSFEDLKIPAGIDSTTLEQQAGKNIISPFIALMSRLARSTDQAFTERTYKRIAEVLTSPQGLRQLEVYAKEPTVRRMTPIMTSILAGSQVSETPESRNSLVPGMPEE